MNTSANRPLIAVVEDEPFMAQLVGDMVASADVDVEVFTLGADLLRSAHLLQFKTILLDLSLPDIDGFDLMERLAAGALGTSIVLMSGHEDATLRAAQIYGNGIGLKVPRVLAKPFARDALLAALGLLA